MRPSTFTLFVMSLTGCYELEFDVSKDAVIDDLINTDDDADDDDETDDTDDTDETTDDDPPVPQGLDACYLGPARDGGQCLATVRHPVGDPDYNYPPPLSGSPQYATPIRYLDLDAISPDTQLAPDFRLGEVAEAWKGQHAVVQPHAIERLQDLRDDVGALSVTSGYRSPGYNAGVGGASSSRHMYGDGFDLVPLDTTLDRLADRCERHGAGYTELYEAHVHCDWRDDALDSPFYQQSRSVVQQWAELPVRTATLQRIGERLHAPSEGWDEGEPLRQWTALSAGGEVLQAAIGRSYVPPAGAAVVVVEIGGVLQLQLDL